MNFRKSTAAYEDWLSHELELVPEDLALKHQRMKESLFGFFRATFYRFAQLWPDLCSECADVPKVLAVGDLHLENFGTWRDIEGRLVWGINDFDEVGRMPYAIDLIRLAASAHIAIDAGELHIARSNACTEILTGYKACLEAGGRPWVLNGLHEWLHDMVNPSLRDPVGFWKKMDALPEYQGKVPGNARRSLEQMMPGRGLKSDKNSGYKIAHRVAGMGSLGRQRFVAIALYGGAPVSREAKALAPSAWDWARGAATQSIRYQKALDTAVRAKDPFVQLEGRWIVRRLAPDCSKINIAAFPREKDETRLLQAMGWETANLHLGSRKTTEVLADISKRERNWLHKAAVKMVEATATDWKEWQGPRRAAAKA